MRLTLNLRPLAGMAGMLGMAAMTGMLGNAAMAQTQPALPDVKAPGVQCTLLASALAIQANPKLPQQDKAAAVRQATELLSPAMRAEHGKLLAAKPKLTTDNAHGIAAPLCAKLLYPKHAPDQLKPCAVSARGAFQIAALHQSGLPREQALPIAKTLSGSTDNKPSAADVKLVNFVYAFPEAAMREQQAMNRVSGAWLDQCVVGQ